MSGLITIAQYKALVPDTTLSDTIIGRCAEAAQAIAEQMTGLTFGAEITAVTALGGNSYKLTVGSPLGDPGDRIRLLGGGYSSTPVEITDCEPGSVTVTSTTTITTAQKRALPVVEFVGKPTSGYVYCDQRPVYQVVSVQTRLGDDVMWSDSTNVKTLTSDQYELFNGSQNVPTGVKLKSSAIPRVMEGGPFLVKRMSTMRDDCVKVTYAAGYYAVVPADLQTAAIEIVNSLSAGFGETGLFASETIDYYTYQRLTYEQMAALPHSAVAVFKRYSSY